jgi:hypothetical protein
MKKCGGGAPPFTKAIGMEILKRREQKHAECQKAKPGLFGCPSGCTKYYGGICGIDNKSFHKKNTNQRYLVQGISGYQPGNTSYAIKEEKNIKNINTDNIKNALAGKKNLFL